MRPKTAMISIMADVIGASDAYDGQKLNDPAGWARFMETVLERTDDCPDEQMRSLLETIDRELFQQWIDAPAFWDDLNRELDRRAQVLMTLMPAGQQGHC